MVNAVGMIHEAIWRDPHWRKLSRSAQATYMQLLSQKELDCAGVLPLQPQKWAQGCDTVTVDDLWTDLEELQRERFVFYDSDNYELFVRSYMRNSNVLKVPNMLKSALRAARLVASEKIRAELAVELIRTGRPEAAETAAELLGEPPVSEPLPEPLPEGLPEPLPEGSGVGKGKGTGVTLSSGLSRGAAPPKCRKHKDNSDTPCQACKKRRLWEEGEAQRKAADELHARRLARERAENCPTCHGTNQIEINENTVRKCNHEGATTA